MQLSGYPCKSIMAFFKKKHRAVYNDGQNSEQCTRPIQCAARCALEICVNEAQPELCNQNSEVCCGTQWGAREALQMSARVSSGALAYPEGPHAQMMDSSPAVPSAVFEIKVEL